MKRIEITIDGKAYPCVPSMGAMLRFKELTGKEYNEVDQTSLTNVVTMMWCSLKSGCAREGIDFDMSLMDFADSMTVEAMQGWAKAVSEGNPGDNGGGEKKSSPGSMNS